MSAFALQADKSVESSGAIGVAVRGEIPRKAKIEVAIRNRTGCRWRYFSLVRRRNRRRPEDVFEHIRHPIVVRIGIRIRGRRQGLRGAGAAADLRTGAPALRVVVVGVRVWIVQDEAGSIAVGIRRPGRGIGVGEALDHGPFAAVSVTVSPLSLKLPAYMPAITGVEPGAQAGVECGPIGHENHSAPGRKVSRCHGAVVKVERYGIGKLHPVRSSARRANVQELDKLEVVGVGVSPRQFRPRSGKADGSATPRRRGLPRWRAWRRR